MPNAIPQARAWNVSNAFWITLVHIVALIAIPFFTWGRLGLALFGLLVLAPLGINVGYHRLLTHRSFTAPRWLRNTLVTIGALIGGGPPHSLGREPSNPPSLH